VIHKERFQAFRFIFCWWNSPQTFHHSKILWRGRKWRWSHSNPL